MVITQSPTGQTDLLSELRRKRMPLIARPNSEPGGRIVIGGVGQEYRGKKGGVQTHAHSIKFTCVQKVNSHLNFLSFYLQRGRLSKTSRQTETFQMESDQQNSEVVKK